MIKTMKVLTVLCLFGVVLGLSVTAETVKETLSKQLTQCSNLLDQGIKNATAHGFDYHKSLFLALLSKVHEGRILVGQLPENATDSDAKSLIRETGELNAYILYHLNDPSPTERLKASAICLVASMKADKHADKESNKKAEQLFESVLSVIRQEKIAADYRIGVPNIPFDAVVQLSTKYFLLERSLEGHNISTFQDYYDLANRTRAFLASSDLTPAKSKEVQEHLEQFDALTLDMAHSWPISGKGKAESYLKLAQMHLVYQMALQELFNEVNEVKGQDLKEILLQKVDNELVKVNDTAAELRERSLNYYADRLVVMLDDLITIRQKVEALPVNMDDPTGIQNSVQAVISDVEEELKNRAPEERIKSEALYCAAILTPANQTQANLLRSKVKSIIEEENRLLEVLGASNSVKGRMDNLMTTYPVPILGYELEKFTSDMGCGKIPSPEDNFRLEKLAEKRAEELKKIHVDEKANALEAELRVFQNQNILMNGILPIDSENKAWQWFVIAQSHHTSAKRILLKLY